MLVEPLVRVGGSNVGMVKGVPVVGIPVVMVIWDWVWEMFAFVHVWDWAPHGGSTCKSKKSTRPGCPLTVLSL